MKKREIKQILELADESVNRNPDFSGFSEPDIASAIYRDILRYRKEAGTAVKDFSPFFENKIMSKIASIAKGQSLEDILSGLLSRVMTYSLTALFIIILTFFIVYGQDGFTKFIGNDTTNDINFISYLFYEF
jgi:hypothetical protein